MAEKGNSWIFYYYDIIKTKLRFEILVEKIVESHLQTTGVSPSTSSWEVRPDSPVWGRECEEPGVHHPHHLHPGNISQSYQNSPPSPRSGPAWGDSSWPQAAPAPCWADPPAAPRSVSAPSSVPCSGHPARDTCHQSNSQHRVLHSSSCFSYLVRWQRNTLKSWHWVSQPAHLHSPWLYSGCCRAAPGGRVGTPSFSRELSWNNSSSELCPEQIIIMPPAGSYNV